MKKYITLTLLSSFIISYVGFSFVFWDFSIKDWEGVTRFFLLLTSFIIWTMILAVTEPKPDTTYKGGLIG